MGGQKRSFFVTIMGVKTTPSGTTRESSSREKSRHPVVKRDLVVHNETDEIPAWTTQKIFQIFRGPVRRNDERKVG